MKEDDDLQVWAEEGASDEALFLSDGDLKARLDYLEKRLSRLELALDGAGVGYWDHDFRSGRVVRNKIWYEMLGYSEEDISSSVDGWKNLVHPEDLPLVEKVAREHEQGKIPLFKVEHRMKTKDGGWKWVMNWGRVVERDSRGNPVRATGIHLDITELKLLEEELSKTEKIETIGILAGGIAHDFNNLLTTIMGNATLLRFEKNLSMEAFRKLEEIEKAVEKAKKLTYQLLTFSRGGEPVCEVASIEEILSDSIDLSLRGSSAKCEMELAPDVWNVEVDANQIGQVFNNLLLNATQAMPEGGVIRIRCRNVTVHSGDKIPLRSGDYVLVEISDEGVGIPQKILGKIFDPFFTTKKSGTGLGLTIAYSITKKHNGYIEVESKENIGTVFRVYLPGSKKKVKRRDDTPGVVEQKLCSRVLIMDDENSIRRLLSDLLSRLGCEVSSVSNSEEAIKVFKEHIEKDRPFDLAILDLTIPGDPGGKYVVEKLKEIDPEVRAIVSSGYSNDDAMSDFKSYGFDGRLNKPFKLGEVYEVVADVLNCRK